MVEPSRPKSVWMKGMTTAERMATAGVEREPCWDTDLEQQFVFDGETPGGVAVGTGEPGPPGPAGPQGPAGDAAPVVVATQDTANSTTTLMDAAGLSFSAEADSTYIVEGFIVWSASATTVGIKLSATAPNELCGHFCMDAANGTPDSSSFNANNVVVTTSASPFTTGNLGIMHALVRTGASPGAFQVRFAAETTGTITIKTGSTLRYRKVA